MQQLRILPTAIAAFILVGRTGSLSSNYTSLASISRSFSSTVIFSHSPPLNSKLVDEAIRFFHSSFLMFHAPTVKSCLVPFFVLHSHSLFSLLFDLPSYYSFVHVVL